MKFGQIVMDNLMMPGDIFEPKSGQTFKNRIIAKSGKDSTWFIWEDSNNKEVYAVKAVLDLEGMIVKKEPQVLTANAILQRSIMQEPGHGWSSKEVLQLIDEGIEQGRLKEWLIYEPVFRALSDHVKYLEDTDAKGQTVENLLKTYKNLKPLN